MVYIYKNDDFCIQNDEFEKELRAALETGALFLLKIMMFLLAK